MNCLVTDIISKKDLNDFREIAILLSNEKDDFLLRNDILLIFSDYCKKNKKSVKYRNSSSIANFLRKIQELFNHDDYFVIMHRYSIAKYRFYLLHVDCTLMEEITVSEYLDYKDSYILGDLPEKKRLHIDYMPFYDFAPSIKDAKSIGSGIRYLNRYLSSNIFSSPEEWNNKLFEFIKLHKYNDLQLLVNGIILTNFDMFLNELQKTAEWLKGENPGTPFISLEKKMKKAGFEAGWGNTASRIFETMQLLIDLINEPTDTLLEQFLSRVPMPLISKVAIISPHGWFAQDNVLGKPDTGGQVIYILDQVKALEKHLKREIELTGLNIVPAIVVVTRFIPEAENTTCNVRKEKIHYTDNCWILRVPFKDHHDNILNHWISRFHVWPYLEKFAHDAGIQIVSELRGRPDLIIGNYSDGNLVASLLSDKLDVIQCTIAHALEKTKYLFSDVYWENMENDYNFSKQFTADIISINKADFIITSTKQEITGTEDTMGQYESYQFFTMPNLFQVESGFNLFSPKFNVIPPGVNEKLYFPYYQREDRIKYKTKELEKQLFFDNTGDVYGKLKDPEKMPIFTMSRLDRIKNITGLIEAFGMSKILKDKYNLIFAAGTTHIEKSKDPEEQGEIKKCYSLIKEYNLFDNIRWLPGINKIDTGEVYRIIADRRGFFVQPALFEAFGLTILESMLSGLPTFGPVFGGPHEVIEEGISGFLLNTSRPELIAAGLESFIQRNKNDETLWQTVSKNGIKRVQEHFTWKLYSERLIILSKLYGFWRYSVSGKGKVKMDRYNDLIYYFLFKNRVEHTG